MWRSARRNGRLGPYTVMLGQLRHAVSCSCRRSRVLRLSQQPQPHFAGVVIIPSATEMFTASWTTSGRNGPGSWAGMSEDNMQPRGSRTAGRGAGQDGPAGCSGAGSLAPAPAAAPIPPLAAGAAPRSPAGRRRRRWRGRPGGGTAALTCRHLFAIILLHHPLHTLLPGVGPSPPHLYKQRNCCMNRYDVI